MRKSLISLGGSLIFIAELIDFPWRIIDLYAKTIDFPWRIIDCYAKLIDFPWRTLI